MKKLIFLFAFIATSAMAEDITYTGYEVSEAGTVIRIFAEKRDPTLNVMITVSVTNADVSLATDVNGKIVNPAAVKAALKAKYNAEVARQTAARTAANKLNFKVTEADLK